MLNENVENGDLSDCDTLPIDQLNKLFERQCRLKCRQIVNNDKYMLHVTGTMNSNPTVACSLNDCTTLIWNLSEDRLAQLFTINVKQQQKPTTVVGLKWSQTDINTFFVCYDDNLVELWDVRDLKKAVANFKDTTLADGDDSKSFSCFDVSNDDRLLSVGTDLFGSDAFILFWDIRGTKLLGGYWESHTDDVTQVSFHPYDTNRFVSGSIDGLINVYDLKETNEDDALIESLNTNDSVERLDWCQHGTNMMENIIFCSTHSNEMQLWRTDCAEPFMHCRRDRLSQAIMRKCQSETYIIGPLQLRNELYVMLGANNDSVFRTIAMEAKGNKLIPGHNFVANEQIVRCTYFNENINVLISGGERGTMDVWEMK